MSNYFPDGRPIQRMMHALSSDATMTAISPTDLTGNVLQALKANFVTNPGDYPGYTTDSFNEMLSQANIMQIMSDDGGKYGLSTSSNSVFAPLTTHGGAYIYGAETIRKISVNNCQVILYIKPTP
jgi:hypothetical protein